MNAATVFGRTLPSAVADIYGAFNGVGNFIHPGCPLMSNIQSQYQWLQSLGDLFLPCLVPRHQHLCLYSLQFMDSSLEHVSISPRIFSQRKYWLLHLTSHFTPCSHYGRFLKVNKWGRVSSISDHVRKTGDYCWTDQGLALLCLLFLLLCS